MTRWLASRQRCDGSGIVRTCVASVDSFFERIATMMNAGLFYCGICDKSFSGAVSYEQHIASPKHLKKQQTRDACPLGELPKCEPCQMVFTGIAPYREHMASAGHAKRASGHAKRASETKQALAAGDAQPSTSTGQAATSEGGTRGGCASCGIPNFESSDAAFDHYASLEHRTQSLALAAYQARAAAAKEAEPVELPPEVLVCRAEEDFAEFCKKHNLFD
ncbi:uncharacterized protein LOC144170629 isoform X1 [Haemaphysalis longicornis]